MSQAQFLMLVGEVDILSAFFAGIGFILVYTVLAPWWRYPVGRTVVALDSALVAITLPQTLHALFGIHVVTNVNWAWFTVITFALVPITIIWRTAVFVQVQRRSRQPHADRVGSAGLPNHSAVNGGNDE